MGRNFGEKKKKRGKSFQKNSKPKDPDQVEEQSYLGNSAVHQEESVPCQAVTVETSVARIMPSQEDVEESECFDSNVKQRVDRLEQLRREGSRKYIQVLIDGYLPVDDSLQERGFQEAVSDFRENFLAAYSQDKEIAILSLAKTARDVLMDPAKANLRSSMAYMINSVFKP